jgi:hypothetical protein
MCANNKGPMLIGGDFNILRFSFEKNKGFHPNRFSSLFNVVIQLYELREIHISGGSTHGLIIKKLLFWKS